MKIPELNSGKKARDTLQCVKFSLPPVIFYFSPTYPLPFMGRAIMFIIKIYKLI